MHDEGHLLGRTPEGTGSAMSMDPYVIRVNVTPIGNTTLINVEGSTIKSYYINADAEDEAVRAALSVVAQRIARKEIEAGDGFTLKVEFVRKETINPRHRR